MNKWAKITLQLVTEGDYLDKLQNVYPQEEGERIVDFDVVNSIRQFFDNKDKISLLEKLLDLDKFPYKDSYIGFLRKDRSAIRRNPQTVKRICDRLYEMGIDRIINGLQQPKEANMRRGNQFRIWIRSNFASLDLNSFRSLSNGIAILDASEIESINFCRTEIGMGISKRPDIVAKSGNHYIVGEAKFLSSAGGNQGRAFDDGIGLATNTSGRAYKIFILDGIHWIEKGSEEYNKIEHSNATIFSILLLKDYLKAIERS